MRRGVLLDTGPLVAYFCPADRFHAWAVEQFASFVAPVTTCEPVLAESCFLLARAGVPPTRILAKLAQGVFRIGLDLEREAAAIATLMQRYGDRRVLREATVTDALTGPDAHGRRTGRAHRCPAHRIGCTRIGWPESGPS